MRRLGLLLIISSLAWGQVAEEANQHYSSPGGRQAMLPVLSSPDRANRLQAEKLVARLGLKPGQTVVDLGTGAGVLLPYLDEAVGPNGTLIAQDIHPEFLNAAKRAASAAGLSNVVYVEGDERDPKLPPGQADMVVAVDAYHHFNYPKLMLAGIHRGLRDGGRFAIVDYYKNGFRDPAHIRADKPEVIRELESGGFRMLKDLEHVPDTQYLIIFEKE